MTGELDETGNVSVVLYRADGQQLQLDGNSFYAVRDSFTMRIVPQPWVTLGVVKDVSGQSTTPTYQTALTNVPPDSVYVDRVSVDRIGNGQDYYDLSGVNPQFSVDSLQLYTALAPCGQYTNGDSTTLYIDGYTSAQWDGNNIRVNLGGSTCHHNAALIQGGGSDDEAEIFYALDINVTGPRGVDPTQKL